MENFTQGPVEQKQRIDLRRFTQNLSYAYICMFVVMMLASFAMGISMLGTVYLVIFCLFLPMSPIVTALTLADFHKKPFFGFGPVAFLVSIAYVLFVFPMANAYGFPFTSWWYTVTILSLRHIVFAIFLAYGIVSLSSKSKTRYIFAWLMVIVSLGYFITMVAILLSNSKII